METNFNEIITNMTMLLLRASGSLEGENQRLADEIDDYIRNIESSEEKALNEIIDFVEWAGLNYVRLNAVWCHRYAPQTNKDCQITTEKLFEVYKYKNKIKACECGKFIDSIDIEHGMCHNCKKNISE